ncbi:MAG: EAL domain-containing protein, partial [Burkholderiaceae bacterium]
SVCENPLDLAFVESIQRIAEILNVKTVAEFVENERIRQKMTSIGVHYLQGYGLHKPEPLGKIQPLAKSPQTNIKAENLRAV